MSFRVFARPVFAAACAVALAACSRDKAQHVAQAAPVTVTKVAARDMPITLNAIGSVEPINSVSVKSLIDGQILESLVKDGDDVKQNQLLFRIDPRPAEAALKQAQAAHDQALSAEAQAQVAVRNAELNLDRTQVRAPVDGYATNVQVRVGDYASAGAPRLALVDSHSYYLYGYFEETKLPQLQVGDPVDVRLMAGGIRLKGRIDSIARGIADRDNPGSPEQLANVNPTFNWVRLAQRIPVRIDIDASRMPAGSVLVAGMTATIEVHPRDGDRAPRQAQP